MTTVTADGLSYGEAEVPLASRAALPILPGFVSQLLPALALWWGTMLGLFFGLDHDYYLAIAIIGTPTLVMLWPVGRALGRRYLSYRPLPWLLGIITMWIIPTAGLVITQTTWSFDTRSAVFFALPAVIAFGGIAVALPWAQSRPPLRMFFRPDLLFGDGRTLVGGTLMLVLGMRYLFAGHPAAVPWVIPKWNWLSLSFGMAAGIIPLVLVRGMIKLVQRYLRLRDGAFSGYPSLAIREWSALLFGAGFGYAFHHVFMGKTVFTTIGQTGWYPVTARFWAGIGIMGAAAWWLLATKGGFKRLVGEPFFFETFGQTFQKQVLFVVGWGAFFYGFMSMVTSKVFGSIRSWDTQSAVGLGFFLTGILVLTLGRAITQHFQRRGMLAHFAGVLIPAQAERARERMTADLMGAMADLPPSRQKAAWSLILRSWADIEPDQAALMGSTVAGSLESLDEPRRRRLIEGEQSALERLDVRSRAAIEQRLSPDFRAASSRVIEEHGRGEPR